MEKYDVDFTECARDLLREHVRFLSNVSTKAARELYDEAYEKIKTLYENPFLYPIWQTRFDLPHEYRKIVIKNRFLVIYFVEGNNVFVDYIFNAIMDNSKFFSNPTE